MQTNKLVYILLIVAILFFTETNANEIETSALIDLTKNITINGSVMWNNPIQNCSTNTTINQTATINYTRSVQCSFNQTTNIKLNNINKSYSMIVHNITANYVLVKFNSNYVVPEKMKVSMYGSNYTFSVVDDMDLYVPIQIDYDKINWSQLKDNAINLTLNYEIKALNISDKLNFKFRYVLAPEVTLIKDVGQFKINDLIVEKLIIETRVPIFNVSAVSDRNAEFKVINTKDSTLIYFTPREIGNHQINYTVIDYFGNKKNLTSLVEVQPLGTHYFYTHNIPSLKVGERSKIKIFEHEVSIPINYTLVELSFVPYNATQLELKNLTALDSLDIYLSDESDNSYFTVLNTTVTITRSKTYFNVLPVVQGDLYLRYKVQTPPELKSNDDFVIKAKIGNYSILDKQEFDIAGVEVFCELSDSTDLMFAKRKCWTEFDIKENTDNSLIILQQRDYENYEQSHAYTMQLLEQEKQEQIKKIENWLILFICLFSVVLIGLLYALYPRDWLVLDVRQEKIRGK